MYLSRRSSSWNGRWIPGPEFATLALSKPLCYVFLANYRVVAIEGSDAGFK